MQTDALDDALTVFAATAPRYGPLGLANHGPWRPRRWRTSAATTPSRLGRAIPGAPRRGPGAGGPAADRRGVAGRARAGGPLPEWLALFEREIADRPAAAVVSEWAARLFPGAVGAADDGLIRTGHAVRALRAADTPRGDSRSPPCSAFWASSYQELPGPPLLIGRERVPEALADLPDLPEEAPRAALISDRVASVADIAGEFEQAVASLGWTGVALDLLDELASGGAVAYLRNADAGGAIGLLHAVTSPLACMRCCSWANQGSSTRRPAAR